MLLIVPDFLSCARYVNESSPTKLLFGVYLTEVERFERTVTSSRFPLSGGSTRKKVRFLSIAAVATRSICTG